MDLFLFNGRLLLPSGQFVSPKAEDKLCKDFLNTIPLISLLGNKAMRPRHWMMLMKATGKFVYKPSLMIAAVEGGCTITRTELDILDPCP